MFGICVYAITGGTILGVGAHRAFLRGSPRSPPLQKKKKEKENGLRRQKKQRQESNP